MPPRSRNCHFHATQPGGCRRGALCAFVHAGPPGSAAQPSVPGSGGQSPRAGGVSSNQVGLPPGACREYWENGKCKNGDFDCRFRHLKAGDNAAFRPTELSATKQGYLEPDGLSHVSGTSTDAFSALQRHCSPTEAHNNMTLFLRPDYSFRTTLNMYSFVATLLSANENHEGWDLSDGYLFLAKIAEAGGAGLLRIASVLNYDNVSIDAGRLPNTLSFQRGFIRLLMYFSSQFVIRSTSHHLVNSLYSLIEEHFENIAKVLNSCMPPLIAARSFAERSDTSGAVLSGLEVFRSLLTVLSQYATRFKQAVPRQPSFAPLVNSLTEWFGTWADLVLVDYSAFSDSITKLPTEARTFLIKQLRRSLNDLSEIVDRAEGATTRRVTRPVDRGSTGPRAEEALLNGLRLTYEGPGTIRQEGPRHDNDFEDITKIRIAPTHAELVSTKEDYLPANVAGAPHHLPSESMERLLDIQFRLLREELIAPIKTSIGLVLQDLEQYPIKRTTLSSIIEKKGGLYKTERHSQESVIFSIYTDVEFSTLNCHNKSGLYAGISFDSPSGKARDPNARTRVQYWENVGRKRLMQGGLVALVWHEDGQSKIYLGVVTSRLDDLLRSVKDSPSRMSLGVAFFDSEVQARILTGLQRPNASSRGMRLLLEAPVMFESIRPFLSTLQKMEPTSLPFSRYLAHPASGRLEGIVMEPPDYATVPGYSLNLSCLFENENTPLRLRPTSEASKTDATEMLKRGSRLDPSQAEAAVNALSSKISLIQGPPGTGKSYTGVQLIRALIKNKIGPILLIAFTNHALDHLLENVLDAGITTSIVRLGSRSGDERIAAFSLDNIMFAQDQTNLRRNIARQYRELKLVEDSIIKLMDRVYTRDVSREDLNRHLSFRYPNHLDEVLHPPFWIQHLFEDQADWITVNAKSQTGKQDLFEFWLTGKDITFLQTAHRQRTKKEKKKSTKASKLANQFAHLSMEEDGGPSTIDDTTQINDSEGPTEKIETPAEPEDQSSLFFQQLGLPGIPPIPSERRTLAVLEEDYQVWRMSGIERRSLHEMWRDAVRQGEYDAQAQEFDTLAKKHEEGRIRVEEVNNQNKVSILKNASIVGCTTNGAAKLTSLLESVQPKVLLVEEAGQVLEAHILASLVPSIQQMILIGDPLQLRPTLANYRLSTDNARTGQIYRFDQSLMERLSSMGFPMSQLEVQRRMRPSVSNLIRKTLYPSLVDHETVLGYPPIRGMAKNVFFLDHRHAEDGGGEDSVSKTNKYEVAMIKDLVLHFLRQGKYSGDRDIVVLCAYLGQLALIRRELSKEVTTVIDERDAIQLIDHEDNPDIAQLMGATTAVAEKVSVSKRVVIRTVDNFQGEEGTIIILSLVRNSGTGDSRKPRGIGFLKSNNRANVALSRAREGLYILGNSDDLCAKSKMWSSVIDELRENDQIGDAFTITCQRHPENSNKVNEPGQIVRIAPDGGCLLPCDSQLPCGHHCPFKCHSDDEHHRFIKCMKPCQKTCSRSHPCSKVCSQSCGNCQFLSKVTLTCGHENEVQCWQMDNLADIKCKMLVLKTLPNCEHSATMPCSSDPANFICNSRCSKRLSCCQSECISSCGECQSLSRSHDATTQTRSHHKQHPCKKPLYCSHLCKTDCSTEHECAESLCQEPCRQRCAHHACRFPCSTPCIPCMEDCAWNCDHHQCPVACGSPCARLPCDERCKNILACNHRCPSVCGEDCSNQVCHLCASQNQLSQAVDVIMGRTLAEIDPDSETLDELVITLTCGHIYTVESLDGICELGSYYRQDEEGQWADLAQPPRGNTGLRKPPVCPACRGPVTARRYGRVFKRGDLDISEQNVANSMTRILQNVHRRLETLVDLTKIETSIAESLIKIPRESLQVPNILPSESLERVEKLRSTYFLATSSKPVELRSFQKLDTIHKIPGELSRAWAKSVKPLFQVYEVTTTVTSQRSAHSIAYEAAFSTLYRRYMTAFSNGTLQLPVYESPEEYAMARAKLGCGGASPKADRRYAVEALWMSIQIRQTMTKVADIWFKTMRDRGDSVGILATWMEFVIFLQESVMQDAQLAGAIAAESESYRQAIKSALIRETSRYDLFSKRLTLACLTPMTNSKRVELVARAQDGLTTAKKLFAEIKREYGGIIGFGRQEQGWLDLNFVQPLVAIIDAWSSTRTQVENNNFTSYISLDEKEAIANALRSGREGYQFATRGHAYQCPNGHTYFIGDCGGANQVSRCPECGATIGGSSHQLTAGNSRSTAMEDIFGRLGAGSSPFAWGAGA